ncbi:polysaccharide transport protein [Tepidibacillus marianensis]|uniref:polysaccharide transport protein n=1 Tax=Tepidibacillus marianensis TaxID=3131995 RepID=UPI0030CEFA9C
MKLRKSIYNIFYGLINLILTTILAILIPRLFLVNFGSEVNGLISSITQIFAYFTLLEAGVGLASLQALYGPVAKEDTASINSILSATNQYYKKTGIIYFFAVIIFAFLYPTFVSTNVDIYIVVIIILLNGMAGVVNLFFKVNTEYCLKLKGKIISLLI